MRIAVTCSALLLSTLPAYAQYPKTLAAMRDHYRPLLVFEGGDARQTERQLTALASHAAELRDRQIVIVGAEGTDKQVPTVIFPGMEWQAVERRFKVGLTEFTVILLGKDGGEKLRSHQPISWEKLKETIDAMPMRKQEATSR